LFQVEAALRKGTNSLEQLKNLYRGNLEALFLILARWNNEKHLGCMHPCNRDTFQTEEFVSFLFKEIATTQKTPLRDDSVHKRFALCNVMTRLVSLQDERLIEIILNESAAAPDIHKALIQDLNEALAQYQTSTQIEKDKKDSDCIAVDLMEFVQLQIETPAIAANRKTWVNKLRQKLNLEPPISDSKPEKINN
jgi:hypothetical protein